MTEETDRKPETGFDQVLGFSIPDRNARGRAVRLGPALAEVLSAHDYPDGIKILLAEALVLCALMGGLPKQQGSQLTMQAQTQDGAVELLVCDYRDGELRGYVKFDEERFAQLPGNPSLQDLFGEGHLAITFDLQATAERYQGIVSLEGRSLSGAIETYFTRSEQVPTLIRTDVGSGDKGCIAGGILVQHLAEGEEGRERLHVQMDHPEWEHVSILTQSVMKDELVDADLSMEALIWRLFHEEREVRVLPVARLTRGCRCSVVHFEEVLARFPKEDRRDMRNENGIIVVDCAFCSRKFPIQD